MPCKSHADIIRVDSGTIINYAERCKSAIMNLYSNGSGSCVHTVFY